MAERKRHAGILNHRQLAFVVAHTGNDTEAARAAGYKNPERSAPKLMKIPSIRRAIAEKQRAIIAASGARIGWRLSRFDILDRLIELGYLPPERTRFNITGQVAALKAIAELEGYGNPRYEELLKELSNRTPEEKEFFIRHGYFKNEVEPSQPGPAGPEGLAQEATDQDQNDSSSSADTASNSKPVRMGD